MRIIISDRNRKETSLKSELHSAQILLKEHFVIPSGITEGERGFEQTKRCYLTEVIPFFKTLKEHFVGVQTALCKEVKEMKEIFDQMNNEVDKNTVDKQCAEIEKKNLLIEMGYGDYVMGNSVISRVYYVEGLGHNLFFVGQFCDFDLEVAFRKHTCFVCDIKGKDILKGSRGTNLYTISIDEMMKSSPICLLSKASKSKSWLWHRRLNHLNFGTINDLARKDLVRGLPKLKFEK
ncbi:integrase, catalytic region, zinc finger, CCHC-type containing protein [Tanacetum coccineum]